jgi:hypothetical protein
MRLIGIGIVLCAAGVGTAQERGSLTCDSREARDGDRSNHCEVKEFTLPLMKAISVDAGKNGGVSIKGSPRRTEILVRARIDTWARAGVDPRGLVSQVQIATAGGQIHASAPSFPDDQGFAVTFEVLVPNRTDLRVNAHNGGIAINDVSGDIEFHTVNGGVKLSGLGGSLRGDTRNGGLSIDLAGDRWEGQELRAETRNGGISVSVPERYSARVEASTVNGRVKLEHPGARMTGDDERSLSVTLGSGGGLIRAETRNGGVIVKRRTI